MKIKLRHNVFCTRGNGRGLRRKLGTSHKFSAFDINPIFCKSTLEKLIIENSSEFLARIEINGNLYIPPLYRSGDTRGYETPEDFIERTAKFIRGFKINYITFNNKLSVKPEWFEIF